ncbi:nucleoside monophosphate kinase [Candidatus Saccharibacteria bacterium]|nr:nucleoside monophosphate kinase [Candidatus Saccharibacteria bacterium]
MEQYEKIKDWLGSGSINIFGLPFAGKDTLAHNLARVLNASVVSGGDILRSHKDQATIKKLMETGELFPTDYYLEIILPYISKPVFAGKPLILSSVGRWSGEEATILRACHQANHPIRAVIHLRVDVERVWQRFEISQTKQDRSHRHDDAARILEIRLKEYAEKTLPVLDFYRQQNLLIEIDGHKIIKDTTDNAIRQLWRSFG